MSFAGVHLSTGRPCQAPTYARCRGKDYCVHHYAVASKEPGRFREATERWVRREAKAESRRRMQSAQIDAFPESLTAPMEPV